MPCPWYRAKRARASLNGTPSKMIRPCRQARASSSSAALSLLRCRPSGPALSWSPEPSTTGATDRPSPGSAGRTCTVPSATSTSSVPAVSARTSNCVPVTRTEPAGVSTVNGRAGSRVTVKKAWPEASRTYRVSAVISTRRLVCALSSTCVPSASVREWRWATGVAMLSCWTAGAPGQRRTAVTAAAARVRPAAGPSLGRRRRAGSSAPPVATRAGSSSSRSVENWQYCESRPRWPGSAESQASNSERSAAERTEPSSRAAQSEAASSAAVRLGMIFMCRPPLALPEWRVWWWRGKAPSAGDAGRARVVFRRC